MGSVANAGGNNIQTYPRNVLMYPLICTYTAHIYLDLIVRIKRILHTKLIKLPIIVNYKMYL